MLPKSRTWVSENRRYCVRVEADNFIAPVKPPTAQADHPTTAEGGDEIVRDIQPKEFERRPVGLIENHLACS